MKCSNLKAHLLALHVVDDPICICQNEREDNHHFFFSCPLYYTQRLKLADSLNAISTFTLEILLNGDDNLDYESNVVLFQAVHDYIKDSERF